MSDTKTIVEAWQLLLLAYFRRSIETVNAGDVYNILNEIEELINRLPANTIDTQRHVLVEFTRGYQEFVKYNYKNEINYGKYE